MEIEHIQECFIYKRKNYHKLLYIVIIRLEDAGFLSLDFKIFKINLKKLDQSYKISGIVLDRKSLNT